MRRVGCGTACAAPSGPRIIDSPAGLSQAKTCFAYECDPGRHLFIAIAENKVAVDADLAAGKRYYIVTDSRMGAWRARVAMTPASKGSDAWKEAEQTRKDLVYVAPVP